MPQAPLPTPDRQPPEGLDAGTIAVINGKLTAISEEMGAMLARTGMSPVIYEMLDFACGLCDAEGQLLAQSNGVAVFTGTFEGHAETILRKFGGRFEPGDIYLVNDLFTGGTHLSDVAVIKPVFADGKLVVLAIAIAHWTELGGTVMGSVAPDATEIFHEGLRFTGVRIYQAGRRADDIEALIAANVRLPEMTIGDLNAEIAAVNIAERRLHDLFASYGRPTALACFDHLIAMSEAHSRAVIRSLPDGIYDATDWIDGTVFDAGRIPIGVSVRIDGDEITFDFTGSNPQTKGPLNCTRGALQSAVKTVFRCLVDPHAPANEGWFRPLHIVVPDGTVFSATFPSSVGWYFELSGHAVDLACQALAPLAPERFTAGSFLNVCGVFITGQERGASQPFVLIENGIGGWGGAPGQDGTSALVGPADGNTLNNSIEVIEARNPVRCRTFALNVADGTGAGRHRGGFGVVREYEILSEEAELYASIGRTVGRAWGVDGGGEGTVNYLEITSEGRSWRASRVPRTALRAGDHVKIVTGGGGGYGSPLTRPADRVVEDVLDGYVTREAARGAYGVAIDEDGGLDQRATTELRGSIASSRS